MTRQYTMNVEALEKLLDVTGKDYLLQAECPSEDLKLQFIGIFNGKRVVWNARIITMEAYSRHSETSNDPMQFIDIRYEDGDYFIDVGLNIRQIQLSTVESTIIMVRKYKRLQLGRHEYGARSKTE